MARRWQSHRGAGTGWRPAGRPYDWENEREDWGDYGPPRGYVSESGRFRPHDEPDDSHSYRRAGPNRGYVGGEPNQGYVGFGPDQGFWRSSGPETYRRRYRGDEWRYGRDYEVDHDRDYGERGWWDRATDEVASWVGDEDAERRRRMDEMRSHRGRGPRGYTRSDDRIREDINDRLTDDYYIDASEIEVTVSNGEVTLSGTVMSRQVKRRAEDIAEDVSGVRHVQNNLRIQDAQTYGAATRSGTKL
jgi:osmotically-inducible protein OsmY